MRVVVLHTRDTVEHPPDPVIAQITERCATADTT